ncbi:hypothetical protein L593_02160 [Salinarchaeum sp. Harcht-Bsk1]|uniref:alpha/beta hydrolase family protein n=1 Tax=Salinarchaeum sp. Harcht-Bsk1 TaxID=1333523 RepID=UPI00034247AB|nr:acetylxylan esterase [Salinarchaeum sp. Harcht-Bsk1]AGN00383.1 hypothetical protein L593_02160 [Salinarchaeum sp. Harcht-Bsk1]
MGTDESDDSGPVRIEGFGPGVDGYYDVGDQLSRYLTETANRFFTNERTTKRSIDSKAAFEARRADVRSTVLASLGGLPDRPDDLGVERHGTIERAGYHVDRITFESLQDFHVTANCYVPDADGPHPAVLFSCGHLGPAKTDELNQQACIELVRQGFVVLIYDPICLGERRQYDAPDASDPHVHSGVYGHSYAGQQCYFAGGNVARFMIADAQAGLDYLAERADVDEGRLGATGTSGGGILTTYLGLLDDRVAVAAPCCAVCERSEWLATGKTGDPEQILTGAIPNGVNADDVLTGMAPKPVCIGAAASDFFPIEGVEEVADRAERIYELYDATERLEVIVADAGHASVYEIGAELFAWFCAHLGDEPYTPIEGHDLADEDALRCTATGSVRAAFEDERSLGDVVAAFVDERRNAAASIDDGYDPERIEGALRERLDLARDRCERNPRVTARQEVGDLDVQRIFFMSERDPPIVVTGVLVADPNTAIDRPAVLCFDEGTGALPARSDEVISIAREHGAALVFDPRGVGAVRHREIPTWYAFGPNDHDQIYGTEYTLGHRALELGGSLFGDRVFDVTRAVAFLRSETAADDVHLLGEGVAAYHALYAAGTTDAVGSVEFRDLGPSFYERATGEYPYDPRLLVDDVLGEADVPAVLSALDDRGVLVDR